MAKNYPHFMDFDTEEEAREAIRKGKVIITRPGLYNCFVLRVRGDVFKTLHFAPVNLGTDDECTFSMMGKRNDIGPMWRR